jgi:hypothetical protein
MITYIQHNDPIILVPVHISKIGCYTSNLFLFVSIHAFIDNYWVLGCFLFLLYTTTFLNWKEVRYTSFIKTADIIVSISTVTHITLYDSYRWKENRIIWINNLSLSIFIFIINEIIFYYLVRNNKSPFYTLPNTSKREISYYINVFFHAIFLHVLLCVTASYLAFSSYLLES